MSAIRITLTIAIVILLAAVAQAAFFKSALHGSGSGGNFITNDSGVVLTTDSAVRLLAQ